MEPKLGGVTRREAKMAIREGAWDCATCGRQRIPGPQKHCGSCGTPRGEDVKFYLPDDARVVEDQAEQSRAQSGPDWNCVFCGGDNPGFHDYCSGCGSPKDPSKLRAQEVYHEPKNEAQPQPKKVGLTILKGCAVAFLLMMVLMVGSCLFLTQTSQSQAVVSAMQWHRTVEIEKYATVTEKGWRDKGQVPSDAKVLKSDRKLRETRQIQSGTVSKTRTVSKEVQSGTRQVKTGVKDLGNGYFEDVYSEEPVYKTERVTESYEEPVYRDEPVYDTEVTYQVKRWRSESKAEQKGNDNSPQWPQVKTDSETREGKRSEDYLLTLKASDGKSYTYKPETSEEFQRYRPDQAVTMSINRLGTVTEVQSTK